MNDHWNNRALTPDQWRALVRPNWEREFRGEWLSETEEERLLRELGERYHQDCDAYDARICSAKNPAGEPRPASSEEYAMCSRYALQVRRMLIKEGRCLGFTEDQVTQSIQHAAKK